MSDVIRTVKLSIDAAERLLADLEADDCEVLGEMISAMLAKIALRRIRAWNEIKRIAEVNEEVESVRFSFLTNEILVLSKQKGEEE